MLPITAQGDIGGQAYGQNFYAGTDAVEFRARTEGGYVVSHFDNSNADSVSSGYDGTFEQFQDYEQFRLTVANTLPADAFESTSFDILNPNLADSICAAASNLPSKKNRPATVETTRKSVSAKLQGGE